MSVRATTWAWEQGRLGAVKGGELLTLLRVADHADNDGICWPGQRSLADYTAQGETTVRGHLRRLEERGLLRSEVRQAGNGRGRAADRILLAIDQPADPAAVTKTNNRQLTDDQPAADVGGTNKGTVKNPQTEVVGKIFDLWVDRLGKTDHRLTPTRRKKIESRLEEGFTPTELGEAIVGVTHSPHHMGENTNGPGGSGVIYDDLELILRNPENVEKFRDLYRQAKRHRRKGADVNERRKQIRREQGLD